MLVRMLVGASLSGKAGGALGEQRAMLAGVSGLGLEGSGFVRFVGILLLVALAGLIGLFVYGQMMEPETREIQTEANYEPQ